EINNPLTFLKGNAELLRRMLAPASGPPGGRRPVTDDVLLQAAVLLEDMEFGARRIQELVQALHRFGRPHGEGKVRVSLADLMKNSLKLTQSRRHENVALEVALPEPGVCVDANAVELETCVVNLLANAFDAVHVSGSRVRLAASLLPYPTNAYRGLVEVSVEDDGPGIRKEIVDEVFTPFCTRKPGGMGLGLSIAYEAATRNGAQIEIQSQEGQGTRVILRLPFDVKGQDANTDREAATAAEGRTG
ncbi:MAG: HAMP domain-containing histidine kinase, partial [Proteobacteria bacterium]|nr:HAMP domain-containing histidine kinase [Pseudomonadota bacterium]